MPSSPKTERARLAANVRHHPEADHTELRRELKTVTLAEHIKRVVDAAPPLTSEQRDRLAVLLRGGPDA